MKNTNPKKNKTQVKNYSRKNLLFNWKFQICIVCGLVLFLYSGVVKNEFIGLDDTSLIVDNYPFIKEWKNIPKAFNQDVFKIYKDLDKTKDYYRPMVTLSFMLDAHLDEAATKERPVKPRLYLISNIIYHALSCVLLLIFLNEIGINGLSSLLLTLFFAVHPLLNQAVAWIPGRNDSILTVFALSSMLFFLKYVNSKKNQLLYWHIFFFALAMFTKESAIMIVPLSLFYILFISKEKLTEKSNYTLMFLYIVVLIPWFLLRRNALEGSTSDITISGMITNIFTNGPLFFQYIGKSLLPFDLSVMSSIQDTNYILGVAVIVLMAAGIFFSKKKRWSYILFGLLWFFLFLTPSLSASLFGGLEHRAYLPLIGFVIVFSEFDWIKSLTLKNTLTIGALVAVIGVFIVVTFHRLSIFQNRFNFYKSAIETAPHSVLSCLNLGKHYEEVGKYNEAIASYRKGLERDSTYIMLHNNIGGAYMYMKMYPEAEKELLEEVRLHPKNSNAIYNLGLIYKSWGRDQEAIDMWKRTIVLENNFIYAYQQLANYYKQKGDMPTANMYAEELRKRGY